MSDKRPLELFRQTFGGTLYKSKIYPSKSGFKTNSVLFVYSAEHKIAVTILTTLLPHMLVKVEQARLALEIVELKTKYKKRESNGIFHAQPYSTELITKLEENWLKVKELNHSRYV
jgi:hypothetical protein